MPLTGGLYPACLARSLAARRRSSLYGSRMEMQFFGTMKQAEPERPLLSG